MSCKERIFRKKCHRGNVDEVYRGCDGKTFCVEGLKPLFAPQVGTRFNDKAWKFLTRKVYDLMSIMTSSRRRVDDEKEQLCMKDICIVRVRIKKILLPVSCFNHTLTQVDLCLLSLYVRVK